MFVYVDYLHGTLKQTKDELNRLKLFSLVELLKNNTIKLKTEDSIYGSNTKKISSMEKTLQSISTITNIRLYPFLKIPKKHKEAKDLYIFFDIDSTLTRKGLSHLDSNVSGVFCKFREHNCSLFFCSGRSHSQIDDLRKRYSTGDYAIAENGGFIIGIGRSDQVRAGKDEPRKVIDYLKNNGIHYRYDSKQHPRKSEFVLLQDSISESDLKTAIKKSKAKAEYHASKDTYHISALNINKGTAIDYLTSKDELDLNPDTDEKIGIGDSGLDVPMFEYCDHGFLVGTPDRAMKAKIKKIKNKITVIKDLPPRSIESIYKRLFPYG